MKKGLYYLVEGYLILSIIVLIGSSNQEFDLFSKIILTIILLAAMYYFRRYYLKKTKDGRGKENNLTSSELLSPAKASITSTILYSKKPFLSEYELSFYNRIKELNNDYIVIPQVNLGAVVEKSNSKYRNELFRNIDFVIFSKDFELLLLIELNDSTHNSYRRKDRDLKVRKILNDCNYKLLVFYTKYPNEKEYVLKRIRNAISSDIIKNDLDIML